MATNPASDLVGKASHFVTDLIQYLEKGAGAWSEDRDRDRRQREAQSSPSGNPKKKAKDEKLLAEIELEANVKQLSGGVVMTMMQSDGVFLEEQHQVVVSRLEQCEQAIGDGNVRMSQLENHQAKTDTSLETIVNEMKELRLENQKMKEELHVQGAWRPAAAAGNANAAVGPSLAAPVARQQNHSPIQLGSEVPRSERLDVRVGRLGWNTSSEELINRMTTLFFDLQIDPSSWRDPLVKKSRQHCRYSFQ